MKNINKKSEISTNRNGNNPKYSWDCSNIKFISLSSLVKSEPLVFKNGFPETPSFHPAVQIESRKSNSLSVKSTAEVEHGFLWNSDLLVDISFNPSFGNRVLQTNKLTHIDHFNYGRFSEIPEFHTRGEESTFKSNLYYRL